MADPFPFANAWVNPGAGARMLTVRDLKVYMNGWQHDMAVAVIGGIDDVDQVTWNVGTPVLIRYGRTNRWDEFYGYLTNTSRHWEQNQRTRTDQRFLNIKAIGASWPLKDGFAGAYIDHSAVSIATDIANKNYFDIDAPADSYVFPALASAGRSYWDFLVYVAKKVSRTCHMHGTQLRFYDSVELAQRPGYVIPRFQEKDAAGVATVIDLTTDSSEAGSIEGRRRRNRVMQSTDSWGNSITGTDDGSSLQGAYGARRLPALFTEYVSDVVVNTQADIDNLLPAVTSNNRFWNRAKATLLGNVRVTQETPIIIEGLGPRDSGMWQVLSVCHHIRPKQYEMMCELGRDADYDNGIRPGLPSGLARTYLDGTASAAPQVPGTQLMNGRWRSTYTTAKVIGS